MKKRSCDLHTHSHYSDGSYSPRELILEAEAMGLSAIALCDHNTTDGLRELLAAAEESSVKAIPAIEFSTDYDGREIHILALYIKPEHYGKIDSMVAEMHRRKDESNAALLAALKSGGIDIEGSIDRGEAKHINRAHFAEALFKCGYADSVKDAFKKYLQPHGGYYTPPKRLDSLEVIDFIDSIGAVSVLAHPFLSLDGEEAVRKFLTPAVPRGLDAMEVYYSTYDSATCKAARALTREFSLLESGGSDFHGTKKPDIKIGTGRGNLNISEDIEAALQAKAVSKNTK